VSRLLLLNESSRLFDAVPLVCKTFAGYCSPPQRGKMSLFPAQSSTSEAATGDDDDGRRRHHFIAWIEAHPARHFACRDVEFVAELTAHPLYCVASRISVQRWEIMFRSRAPSHAHAQQWHKYGIAVGAMQRSALLARSDLRAALVLRLLRFQVTCRASWPLRLAKCTVSRRHFRGLKNQAACLFHEGQRLHGEQRFSEAARSWGQAVLLQRGASHAFLSTMLIEGRSDVAKDEKRAFELAAAGAAMGCAHSKGMLSRCYVVGNSVAQDVAKGRALQRLCDGTALQRHRVFLAPSKTWASCLKKAEVFRRERMHKTWQRLCDGTAFQRCRVL
jgi:hypothetical protein